MPPGITDPNYKPLPGRLGNLTQPQQDTLDAFKKELKDDGVFVQERMDDAMLLRCIFLFPYFFLSFFLSFLFLFFYFYFAKTEKIEITDGLP